MSLSGNAIGGKRLTAKITTVPEVVYIDAYKLALQNGFEGTVEDWLATIKGEKGDKGDPGDSIKGDKGDRGEKGDPFTYEDFTAGQLAALKGEKGDKGDKGDPGVVTIDGIPPASKTQLGGIKVGDGLDIDENGILSASGGGGGGLTDITSTVFHNSMGSIYKAYDTGTSIYLYFRGESENMISISGRTEQIIYTETRGSWDFDTYSGKTYGGTLGSFSLPYVDIDDAWAVIHYMPK